MITPSLVQLWFGYACQQMQGVVQACIYLGEAESGPYKLFETYPDSFVHSELIHENVEAALKRRKSVVTRTGASQGEAEVKRLVAVNAAQPVSTASGTNYLMTCPLLIGRELHGAISIEFKNDHSVKTQDYLKSVEAAIMWRL